MVTLSAGNDMPWRSYLRIIRPVNLLIMAAMLLLVRYAIFMPVFRQNGLEGLMPGWQFLLLVIATVCIGAGGYVINDVLDIEMDRINKPGKQVIGRQISEAKGNKLHVNLTAAGIIFGIVFSYLSGNIFLGILFVIIPTALFYYSYKYKYLPVIGNLVVALLAALVVIIYWLFEFYHLKGEPGSFIDASLSFSQLNRFVLAFAFFAFLTTLAREIIKDAQDMEGDTRFGCRTIPVVLGTHATRYLLIALEIMILGSLVWFQTYLATTGYVWMAWSLGPAQALLLYAVVSSYRAGDKASFSRLSLVLKLVMVSGMLSLFATWFRNY
ncbi:MAG: UbiA family prenyltransferase [Bacteroidales bacterium]|jgi:4-hydroxybenzoate polyprenyltransferase|nr:UbiA family prenyltransferase [Bacteroidales bacterium]